MLPFARQVLIACDAAKNGIARLSGEAAPKFDDNETSFAELKERISKTIDYLNAVPAEKINGTEEREITFPVGRDATRTLNGEAYLKHWMLPNMFFHVTMAYAILAQQRCRTRQGRLPVGLRRLMRSGHRARSTSELTRGTGHDHCSSRD